MIASLVSVWLFAQLPAPSCARGEKTEREERRGRVTLTCSLKGKKLRRVSSDRGVRTVTELATGTSEDFLESSGQRLSRSTEIRLGVANNKADETWWPDGCLLSSKTIERGEWFFEACARKRSEAPDGGTGDRVVVIPPAFASMLDVDRLSTLGLALEHPSDGGVRVCLSDAGPCTFAPKGNVMVFNGEQTFMMLNREGALVVLDRAHRTIAPVPEGVRTWLGGNEMSMNDGGSIDLVTGARHPIDCKEPLRKLADGSLLCRESTGNGYRRVWKDRERLCPGESLGPTLISPFAESYRPSVMLLSREADPQCLEVFAGMLDWVP